MNFTRQIHRIQKIHRLIKTKATGKPNEFASKLGISRRQLYNELDFLKMNDAPLKYSRDLESFVYTDFFDLEISLTIKILNNKEEKEIFGGHEKKMLQCNCIARSTSIFTM